MRAKDDDEERRDKAPIGWEGSVRAMKKHPEISNVYALANWMASNGFHPHDALNKDTLDACHEMYTGSGMHDDGKMTTAGGKPQQVPAASEYEKQTEETESFGEESEMYDENDPDHDGDFHGPGVHGEAVTSHGAGHSPAGHGHVADDEEKLLDDSEVAGGEDLPTEINPTSDPKAAPTEIGVHSNISDPEPDVKGISAFDDDDEHADDDDKLDDDDETEHDDD